MTITNGYCTLAELRTRLQFETGVTAEDTRLEQVVEDASRWIDDHCNRSFYTTTEARYFTADSPGRVFVDDLVSVSSFATDESGPGTYGTVWNSTYYNLCPYNAAGKKEPYNEIEISHLSIYTLPTYYKAIKITGNWGWVFTTAPGPIKEACLLMSARLYQRKSAVFGVQGTNALGSTSIGEIPIDNDVRSLLARYVKRY
jgi:hypothetical protein